MRLRLLGAFPLGNITDGSIKETFGSRKKLQLHRDVIPGTVLSLMQGFKQQVGDFPASERRDRLQKFIFGELGFERPRGQTAKFFHRITEIFASTPIH